MFLLGASFTYAHFILGRPLECLLYATSVLRLLPLVYRGLLPGASLRMPTLFWGVQWSACLSGLHRATLVLFATFILGIFLGYCQINPPFIRASVCWSFLSDAFSSSLVIQLSWVLAFSRRQCIFAFIAGLFKDKVYPLSISSWCLFG